MFGNVFLKSLYDQRRAMLGWSIGLVLYVAVMAAIWPSVRDMPNLDEFLANYPEAMRELWGIEDFTTGPGYLNAELFTFVLPLLFVIFGIGRGARMIAGEEEAGTLEVLLVTPVSAMRVLLHKAAALAITMFGLCAVLFAAVLVSSVILGMGVGVGDLAAASLTMLLIGVEFGCLALAVGAMVGRRTVAVAVASTVAVGAYALHAVGQLVEAVEPWQPISPFNQALADGPLGAGLRGAYVWMAVAAIVFIAAAVPVFDRRDIRAR